MPWPQTDTTQYHAQLELPDRDRAIKGLVVYNKWDLEPLDLLNGLALGCYKPSPEVCLVSGQPTNGLIKYILWLLILGLEKSRKTPARILPRRDWLRGCFCWFENIKEMSP